MFFSSRFNRLRAVGTPPDGQRHEARRRVREDRGSLRPRPPSGGRGGWYRLVLMGHPAPSTGRRSAASTAGSPRCNSCGCRPNAAAAACLPAAAASLFGATSVRDTQIARTASVRRSANGKGGLDPSRRDASRHDSPALRPAVARSSARYRNGSRRPSAVLGTPPSLHNQRHGARCLGAVHLPARCDTIAAWHVGRGVPRPGRVSPTDAGLLQRAPLPRLPGFPGKCRIATATPNCFDAPRLPWTSGWPRRMPSDDGSYMGVTVHPSSAHHHRRVFSSPCRQRVRAGFSAPSLPDPPTGRHAAEGAFGRFRPQQR